MTNPNQTHVLLESKPKRDASNPQQKCLRRIARAFLVNRRNDYLPIVYGTLEYCRRVADRMRPIVHERQNRRQGAL
jgi:hypothetical protein